MIVVVLNKSGNVGKSALTEHFLSPRIGGELLHVESINAVEGDSGREKTSAREFTQLFTRWLSTDSGVWDVGSSEFPRFTMGLETHAEAHAAVDFFVLPTISGNKPILDTISSIQELTQLGVEPRRIKVIFNLIDPDLAIADAFGPLLAYHADTRAFDLQQDAVIYRTALFQMVRELGVSIGDLVADKTDYAALGARSPPGSSARQEIAAKRAVRALALGVSRRFDALFELLFPQDQ